jgi:hypothetical protein
LAGSYVVSKLVEMSDINCSVFFFHRESHF